MLVFNDAFLIKICETFVKRYFKCSIRLIWLFSLNETGLMFLVVVVVVNGGGRLRYRRKATIAQSWTNEERD